MEGCSRPFQLVGVLTTVSVAWARVVMCLSSLHSLQQATAVAARPVLLCVTVETGRSSGDIKVAARTWEGLTVT